MGICEWSSIYVVVLHVAAPYIVDVIVEVHTIMYMHMYYALYIIHVHVVTLP